MIEQLREKFGKRVKENEMLAKHTNFRIGGPARYFFEAKTSEEMVEAVQAAQEAGLEFFILGGGSNTLISDEGFDGLVVKAGNRNFEIRHQTPDTRHQKMVFAEAGIPSALLARKTAEAGLTGFEWASSLPGTIGGAVYGNSGCFGGEMKGVVKNVKIFDPQKTTHYSLLTTHCKFGYRDSVFKHTEPKPIILSVEMELKKDEPADCLARVEANIAKRKQAQPFESSSAGCLFKNFEFQDEKEIAKLKERAQVPEEFIKSKKIPAGWIVDQLGLKGKRIGDAMVSDKHGNFVLNTGQAKADHVIQLMALIKTRARNELNLQLQDEVQLIGF